MSTTALEWRGNEPGNSVITLIPVAAKEFKRHMLLLVGIFTVIALTALAVGLLLPKKYTSSTTILVEESNIIGPLMEGRAVPTGVSDRANIALQVAFSRRVMNDILQTGGWTQSAPTPVQRERLIEEITDRTHITNPSENLIQITYTDSDPKRSFEVTRRFADLVIDESLAAKERESRDAYQFINSQVNLYHQKLTDAESKLEAFRNANPDARPGIDTDVNARINNLQSQIESGHLDRADFNSQASAIQSQLAGENEISVVQTRIGQYQARMAELQSQRQQLLLTYTEQYPDVVRIEHQIRDLQDQMKLEKVRQDSRLAADPNALNGTAATMNPLYGQLRSQLADARQKSAAVSTRVSTAQSMLDQELDRSKRIAASESKVAELTRDYEVNRDLYQDLLKRRENARVSMNLDAEHRGLSFRIQEPAVMPLRPSGLRLMHIAGAGLGLATLAPLLLLLGFIRFDPRVRTPLRIERDAGLPVIAAIPVYRTAPLRKRALRRVTLATLILLSVPVAYAAILALKLAHTL